MKMKKKVSKVLCIILAIVMLASVSFLSRISNAATSEIVTANKFNSQYILVSAAEYGAKGYIEYDDLKAKYVDVDTLKENGETIVYIDSDDSSDGIPNANDAAELLGAMWILIGATDSTVDITNSTNEIITAKKYDKTNNNEEISIDNLNIKFSDANGNTILELSDQSTLYGQYKDDIDTLVSSSGNSLEDELRYKIIDLLYGDADALIKQYYSIENAYTNLFNKGLFTGTISIYSKINGKNFYYAYGYSQENPTLDGDGTTTNINNGDPVYINLYMISDKTDDEFSTTISYTAEINDEDVGGTSTTEDGNDFVTFIPNSENVDTITVDYTGVDVNEQESYYEKLQTEYESLEADVTAIIKSETDEGIVAVNDVAMNSDGTANSLGWYYPDTSDITVIAKDYSFHDYNNSDDNGIVEEEVALTGETGRTDEQTVSIKWKFRIIDVIYDENDDGSVTVTVVTNLPMDPDKIEEGWEYVDGSEYHEIRRTYEEGDDIDEDVTVYQNETGESDSTNIKINWKDDDSDDNDSDDNDGDDNTTADEDIPNTGASIVISILAVCAVIVAIIVYIRKKKLFKK